jgi:hypothetical protein
MKRLANEICDHMRPKIYILDISDVVSALKVFFRNERLNKTLSLECHIAHQNMSIELDIERAAGLTSESALTSPTLTSDSRSCKTEH